MATPHSYAVRSIRPVSGSTERPPKTAERYLKEVVYLGSGVACCSICTDKGSGWGATCARYNMARREISALGRGSDLMKVEIVAFKFCTGVA